MRRGVYIALAAVILAFAGMLIYRALSSSLVYFILPSEYAKSPQQYDDRRLRLGGIVEAGSVDFDTEDLRLTFHVTDSVVTYPVRHFGAPPELFQENTGVVVEGHFEDGVFVSDNLLVKHSEVYQAPEPGEPVNVEALKESLQ
ncbi:MAG TPA: cytochrome c maturation protein CcmE [Trueperaceae bacterium]